MSNQNEITTPQELREALLAEIENSKQVIAELSDEQLEEVAGGAFGRAYVAPPISWSAKPQMKSLGNIGGQAFKKGSGWSI
jgi:hypothetical protein